jgi:hypothetical protein
MLTAGRGKLPPMTGICASNDSSTGPLRPIFAQRCTTQDEPRKRPPSIHRYRRHRFVSSLFQAREANVHNSLTFAICDETQLPRASLGMLTSS